MSVAYSSIERRSESGRRLSGPPNLALWLGWLLVPLGVSLMLAGPITLLGPGFLLVLVGWLARGRGKQGWLAQHSPLDAGWLALLVGSLIGYVASPNPAAALGRLGAIIAALTLFFWLQSQVRSPRGLRLASWGLVAACGLGGLLILALIRGQLPNNVLTRLLAPLLGLFAAFPGVSGDVLEVNSRFPVHQYGLAYLLLVSVPFLAAEAAFASGWARRMLAAGGALALATFLAATEARGALLALAIAVAFVASVRSRWFWGLLPLAAAAVYLLLARGIISRSIEVSWLETRLSIWTRSLNLLSDYPFSGVGLGMQTFAEVFAWNFGLPNPYLVVHSHNIFIQAYAEQGLLGLVGLTLALGAGLLFGWKSVKTAPGESRPAAAGVLGALTASLLYGLTDQVPTTNDGLAILAVLCALAVAGARLVPTVGAAPPHPSARARRRRPYRSAALFALCAAALLVAVVPRWASGLALNFGAVQLAKVALNSGLESDRKVLTLGRAERALEAAASWNPRNVAAFRDLARVRLLRHDVPGALAALDRALAAGPLNDYERMQLGRVYLELGFWQQAFDLWQAAGQDALLRQAADDLAARNDFKGAAAAHAALVELNPEQPENYSNLAKAILAGPVPSVDEAMLWFERAAELNPQARRSLSRQLVLQGEDYRINERRGGGRFDLAVFWFSLASRVDPTYDRPEVELGAVHYYAGRYGEAAGHFQAAIERDPQNSSSWHQLGQAEDAAGHLPQALAAFEQAVRLGPSRASLRASLGHIYLRTGRCDAARYELNEALRLEPANGLARADLARLDECR
jgi:tetratricopeptide (TPR) repeat protein/O-antigen ligase